MFPETDHSVQTVVYQFGILFCLKWHYLYLQIREIWFCQIKCFSYIRNSGLGRIFSCYNQQIFEWTKFLIARYSFSISSGVRMVRAIGLLIWNPQYTHEFVHELVIYRGINIEIVLPNRSSVYLRLRRAIGSRNFSAAGEISAIKSSTSQCDFPNARNTSASVFE